MNLCTGGSCVLEYDLPELGINQFNLLFKRSIQVNGKPMQNILKRLPSNIKVVVFGDE